MSEKPFELDELDRLATEAFPGLVVRKDLLRRMRSAFGVPAFVIEFLLGKYCASTDEQAIQEGLEFVRETLSSKYVKPNEREAVKSAIKQHTTYEVIDKISVRLVETHDKYWARLSNLDLDHINIDEREICTHDRLLMGGIWAEVALRYDDSFVFKTQNRPFFVESIRPIQLSTCNIDQIVEGRRCFARDQWLDLLMRSMGYEPDHPYYTPRRKLHCVQRLVPFVEKNYNSVELGPRGTGKSFVYQQLSPYSHLVSGGQTTTAQMFVNLSTGQKGLVALWDVVAFDEAAGVSFTDKNGNQHHEELHGRWLPSAAVATSSTLRVRSSLSAISTAISSRSFGHPTCSTRCRRRWIQRSMTVSTPTSQDGSSRRPLMRRTQITSGL